MWLQLSIKNCPREAVEEVSDQLEALGALSLSLSDQQDNPILEPELGTTPLWPTVLIQALFLESSALEEAQNQLSQLYTEFEYATEVLVEKDWERAWMDDFKPQAFGRRLWICPSWIAPPKPEAINLILDPGLAFGTGTHPTTALCLRALDASDLNHKTLIDYGCGSGILALAALKLGAQQVSAVDIDPQALEATQNNALNNGIDLSQLSISSPEVVKEPADVLIANILLDPLIALKQRFYQLLHPHGELLVSGLLSEQATTLIQAYEDRFGLKDLQHQEGWALIHFSKLLS